MAFEIVPYAGRERNAKFVNGGLELVVTMDVGPRILHFGFEDGPNMFRVYEKAYGLSGGDEYRSYGGHRLWVSPESKDKITPDNDPVEVVEDLAKTWFASGPDKWGIKRKISIEMTERRVVIGHVIENLSAYPIRLAPWAITVMEPGGEVLIPSHQPSDDLLPVRPVALWGYTTMDDPRYTWGNAATRLQYKPGLSPTKFGTYAAPPVAAYSLNGIVFVKTFDSDAPEYPDFGCNVEAYTREGMVEVESLGGLCTLAPGEKTHHTERWHLRRETPPDDDEALGAWFADLMD